MSTFKKQCVNLAWLNQISWLVRMIMLLGQIKLAKRIMGRDVSSEAYILVSLGILDSLDQSGFRHAPITAY